LQRSRDGRQERLTPQDGAVAKSIGKEKNTTHARARSITGAQTNGAGWEELSNTSGPGGQLLSQPPKIIEEIVNVAIKTETVTMIEWKLERRLEGAEKPPRTWERKDHGPEFTKDLVPVFGGDPASGAGNRGKDLMKPSQTTGWKADGGRNSVNHPTQDGLGGGESAVTFEKLFDRGGLLAVRIVSLGEWAKHKIKGMEDGPLDSAPPGGGALGKRDEVIDINIRVGQGLAGVRGA